MRLQLHPIPLLIPYKLASPFSPAVHKASARVKLQSYDLFHLVTFHNITPVFWFTCGGAAGQKHPLKRESFLFKKRKMTHIILDIF